MAFLTLSLFCIVYILPQQLLAFASISCFRFLSTPLPCRIHKYFNKECAAPACRYPVRLAPNNSRQHTHTHTLTIVINQSFLLNNNVQTHENAHERIRLRQPNPSQIHPLHPTRPTKKESKRQKKKIRLCKQDLETSTGRENKQTGKQMRHAGKQTRRDANRQGGR